MKKRLIIGAFSAVIGIGIAIGIAYAAFADKGQVLGSKFSVGNADIKILLNPSLPPSGDNLTDDLAGPSFEGISPYWSQPYLIKFFNNGTDSLQMASNSEYLTINDPDDLRQLIYVEPFVWNDINGNGLLEEGEKGESFGRKTIIKWKTEGFLLGTINSGETKGFILNFSTDTISDTKQGKSGIFDFLFDAIQVSSTP